MMNTVDSVCNEIKADMERDVKAFDGKPMTGLSVGTQFGNQGAAIAALAGICSKQQEQIDELRRRVDALG